MSRAGFLKALLAAGALGTLAAAMSACAALQAAGNHATEAGGAAAGGAASLLFGLTGPIAAVVAGVCGWLGGLLFTPTMHTVGGPAGAGGFPWGLLVLGAVGALVLRAWGHSPAILRDAWSLTKTSARALLGALHRNDA